MKQNEHTAAVMLLCWGCFFIGLAAVIFYNMNGL